MKQLTVVLLLAVCFTTCKKNSGSENPKIVMVSTIAGTGEPGYLDASAAFAKFHSPHDLAVHTDGTIYITDYNNRRVRRLTPEGLVFTFAGNGNPGKTNGPVATASFIEIGPIALDAAGDAYILDGSVPQVRKITGGANVSVFGGTGDFGFADGPVNSAKFRQGWGIAIDNTGAVYIADTFNERIRKIDNGMVTTVAGTGTAGYLDGNALQAQFRKPRGIALDRQGNLYVCDSENYRIRKITPAGIVSTYAGNGTQGFEDGGPGTAQFNDLADMVIDNNGNLYVTDIHRIRKISPAGEVSTLAGAVQPGYVDGEGSEARFTYATGLAIDAAGNIYVADHQNNRIRKISFE